MFFLFKITEIINVGFTLFCNSLMKMSYNCIYLYSKLQISYNKIVTNLINNNSVLLKVKNSYNYCK